MAKLTFTRLRAKGQSEWIDPGADVRKVLPCIVRAVLDDLRDSLEDTPFENEINYLRECLEVFDIRLVEDPKDLASQVSDLLRCLDCVPDRVKSIILSRIVAAGLCVYGLFVRRYTSTDADALKILAQQTRLQTLGESLTEATLRSVKEELGSSVFLLANSAQPDTDGGIIKCIETGDEIDHVKRIACNCMHRLGQQTNAKSWDEMAEACDSAFTGGKAGTDNEAVCLALAYPAYRQGSLVVTTDNGSAAET